MCCPVGTAAGGDCAERMDEISAKIRIPNRVVIESSGEKSEAKSEQLLWMLRLLREALKCCGVGTHVALLVDEPDALVRGVDGGPDHGSNEAVERLLDLFAGLEGTIVAL